MPSPHQTINRYIPAALFPVRRPTRYQRIAILRAVLTHGNAEGCLVYICSAPLERRLVALGWADGERHNVTKLGLAACLLVGVPHRA